MVSADGARTFREVYAAAGSLTGFALSPDGAEVALGGADDGILVASTRDFRWKKVSDVHAQCLTWTTAGIYACGVEWLDRFVIGLSRDRGATFEALSHMSDPCPMRCAAGSTAGRICTGDLWRATQNAIKQDAGACSPAPSWDGGAAPETGPRSAWVFAALVLAIVGLGGAVLARHRRRGGAR